MADQPKKKPRALVKNNDDRPNKKAWKTDGPSHTRKTRLSELEKALMGGGAMRRIMRRLPESD